MSRLNWHVLPRVRAKHQYHMMTGNDNVSNDISSGRRALRSMKSGTSASSVTIDELLREERIVSR
jgi:hypothetical protein